MSFSLNPFAPIFDLASNVIDKLFPNASDREKAKYELIKLQQDGSLKELEARMSAIIEEAKSADPWTSRARPSFLYVMYIMILSALPMGALYAFEPSIAHNIATGMQEWLKAIPEALYALFGAGYLGYSGARSYDKAHKK
jgi:hypothetical protein